MSGMNGTTGGTSGLDGPVGSTPTMADDDKVITCRCGNPLNTVAALEAMFLRTDIKPGHNSGSAATDVA